MVTGVRGICYTYAEYLAFEDASNSKHEFLDGEIYAVAGGTPEHAALVLAVGSSLLTQLRGGACRAYGSELRVRVMASGLVSYPDATVICGEPEHDPESRTTVTNPRVVVEVTSPSTEAYDRGEKLAHYQRIVSVQEAVIVSHRERVVEVWRRTAAGWTRDEARSGARLRLDSIDAELNVDQIYDDAGVSAR